LGTTIQSGGIPIFSFLDPILTDLAEGDISFLAIGLYSLMVLYLQGCAVKGNLVFGLRIPFILNYHPMKPNKTYLNSFLFNVNMMMLTSVATTQLTILAFPTYLESSYLGELFADAIFNLPMFGWLYSNRIFMGVFCIVSIMSIFVMIYRIVVLCLKKGKNNEQE
jgi:LMBR1 domain-containing protein 1